MPMRALLLAATLALVSTTKPELDTTLPTFDDVLADLENDKEAAADLKSEVYADRVTRLYKDVNPEKLSTVPGMLKKYRGREEFLLAALNDKYPWGKAGKDVTFLIFPVGEAKKDHPDMPPALAKKKKKFGVLLFFFGKKHQKVGKHFSALATAASKDASFFAMDCDHERNNAYCLNPRYFQYMDMQLQVVDGKDGLRQFDGKFNAKDMNAYSEQETGLTIDYEIKEVTREAGMPNINLDDQSEGGKTEKQ